MRFQLKALSESGQLVESWIEAESQEMAKVQALAQGLTVVSIQPEAPPTRRYFSRRQKFSLLLFSQHLVSLLQAGLTVVEALEALAENEARQSAELAVLGEVLAGVKRGLSFSAALELCPDCFPAYYVATVRASEQGGGVAEALARWSVYQEQIEAARRQVSQTMIYPIVLVVAGFAVSLFLLIYVVPRFATIYEGRTEDLPWLSMLLVKWGQLAAAHGASVVSVLVLLAGFAFWAIRRPEFRAWAWQTAWQLPTIGERLRLYQLARLYRTVGMLLRGGMPVADALDLIPGLMVSALRERVNQATAAIRSGRSIFDAFKNAGLTTPVSERMLIVGQRAGNMDEMMERIASYYDAETNRALTSFVKAFEPLVMAVIGVLVGGIVVLMYIPIFEIAGRLQS